MRCAIILTCLLASCSTWVPAWASVDCRARVPGNCPSAEQVQDVFFGMADLEPALDPAPPIEVTWVDPTVFWVDSGLEASGYTVDEQHMTVSSCHVMLHERWHAHFFQKTGDGDANHAKSPGPWHSETDEAIEKAKPLCNW